ncbi:MAG: hypothetical protein R2695_05180 [Acidimicrobiales bacterium]
MLGTAFGVERWKRRDEGGAPPQHQPVEAATDTTVRMAAVPD